MKYNWIKLPLFDSWDYDYATVIPRYKLCSKVLLLRQNENLEYGFSFRRGRGFASRGSFFLIKLQQQIE